MYQHIIDFYRHKWEGSILHCYKWIGVRAYYMALMEGRIKHKALSLHGAEGRLLGIAVGSDRSDA